MRQTMMVWTGTGSGSGLGTDSVRRGVRLWGSGVVIPHVRNRVRFFTLDSETRGLGFRIPRAAKCDATPSSSLSESSESKYFSSLTNCWTVCETWNSIFWVPINRSMSIRRSKFHFLIGSPKTSPDFGVQKISNDTPLPNKSKTLNSEHQQFKFKQLLKPPCRSKFSIAQSAEYHFLITVTYITRSPYDQSSANLPQMFISPESPLFYEAESHTDSEP